MPGPFERRAITFEGKPVLLYVNAEPHAGQSFVARCHGVTMAAHDEGLTEEQYVERILAAAADMGLTATLRRRDDREIVFDVKAAVR